MTDGTGLTTIVGASERSPRAQRSDDVTALVIAWCSDEPGRVGEVAIVPEEGPALVLGRDSGAASAEPGVRFFRQRPGRLEPTPALSSRGLSRRQLSLRASSEGLTVTNVGQCTLEVNGTVVDTALIEPGDVLHLRRELVLYCTRRPALIPPSRQYPAEAAGAFGEPDQLGILGEAPSTWDLRENIAFAAKAERHTLVTGQSGTGKELAARAVHTLSPRAGRKFVARNAATLPAGLVDAELFGNARNYPNPGMSERGGLIGEADGGTLFLDEIGELGVDLQSHLLRVLDSDGEYQRLGEATSRRSTFCLVAATNRSADALKHDLAARFAAVVAVPELADRREDIPLLASHILKRAAQKSPQIAARFMAKTSDGRTHPRLAPELISHLLTRDYGTNVRELDALLWRAMAASRGDAVELPPDVARPPITAVDTAAPPSEARAEPTAEELKAALVQSEGSVPRAAKALGLKSRYVLYRLLKKHGIPAKEE